MIQKICAVRDRAADMFMTPMFVPALGMAVRSFADEVNRKQDGGPLASHPEDFDLYEVGDFETSTCEFVLLPKPRQIAVGKDMVRKEA